MTDDILDLMDDLRKVKIQDPNEYETVWLVLYKSLDCQYSGKTSDFVVVFLTMYRNLSCKNPRCELSLGL